MGGCCLLFRRDVLVVTGVLVDGVDCAAAAGCPGVLVDGVDTAVPPGVLVDGVDCAAAAVRPGVLVDGVDAEVPTGVLVDGVDCAAAAVCPGVLVDGVSTAGALVGDGWNDDPGYSGCKVCVVVGVDGLFKILKFISGRSVFEFCKTLLTIDDIPDGSVSFCSSDLFSSCKSLSESDSIK